MVVEGEGYGVVTVPCGLESGYVELMAFVVVEVIGGGGAKENVLELFSK